VENKSERQARQVGDIAVTISQNKNCTKRSENVQYNIGLANWNQCERIEPFKRMLKEYVKTNVT
jgi:hypothetical protein